MLIGYFGWVGVWGCLGVMAVWILVDCAWCCFGCLFAVCFAFGVVAWWLWLLWFVELVDWHDCGTDLVVVRWFARLVCAVFTCLAWFGIVFVVTLSRC